jgi:hypothetical protein
LIKGTEDLVGEVTGGMALLGDNDLNAMRWDDSKSANGVDIATVVEMNT